MCEPMLKVKDIMCKKVVTAKEDMPILEAVQLLNDRHVGSLVVVDDEQNALECLLNVTPSGCGPKSHLDEPLSKVMSRHVVTISLEASFDEAKCA